MESIAADSKMLHRDIADFYALFVGSGITCGIELETGLLVVAAISSTIAAWSVNGRLRQFCVMWHNIRCSIFFHFKVLGR